MIRFMVAGLAAAAAPGRLGLGPTDSESTLKHEIWARPAEAAPAPGRRPRLSLDLERT
jgi:hypothetical protein